MKHLITRRELLLERGYCLLCWAYLAFLLPVGGRAQPGREALLQALSERGMLELRISADSGHWIIGLEQARYRFAPRGLSEVFEVLKTQRLPGADTLSVVVYARGIPLLELQSVGGGPVRASWDRGKNSSRLRGIEPIQPVTERLEILLSPGLRYQLGNLDLPALIAADAQVGCDYLFRPGWSVQGMVALPVFNNLDEKTRFRLERAVLVHDRIIPGRAYFSLSGGVFSHNRMGGHFSSRVWLPDERFSLRLDAGLTGFTRVTGPVISESTERGWFPLFLAAVEYRWRRYELNARLSAGRFLYQDDGIALEIFRQMGEYRVGFFGTATSVGTNIGFQLSVPLFPARYARPGRFRVRVAEQFPFIYRYRGLNQDARRYQAGNMLVDQLYGYYPGFFLREMEGR